MASCCEEKETVETSSCCGSQQVNPSGCCGDETISKKTIDWLFWSMLTVVVVAYLYHLAAPIDAFKALSAMSHGIYQLINTMFIGVLIGVFFVGLIGQIPKKFINAALGKGNSLNGILRATFAGVMLDLCSHGILLVAMRLYERGASLGQVMAFLIASPWNSFSLTIILIALIGWQWTLVFLFGSMLIGIISGLIFEWLVSRRVLPANPNSVEHDEFAFWSDAKKHLSNSRFSVAWFFTMLWQGMKDSRVLIRWLLLGVVLAAAIRAFVPLDSFQNYFGATLAGLGFTLLVATIIEICSEGSTPIAADLVSRAGAPGNGFAFLMAGVSTDYTEIVTLKEASGSWKVALFLPLVTLPQIIVLALVMNMVS
jgi:hypothetical protein